MDIHFINLAGKGRTAPPASVMPRPRPAPMDAQLLLDCAEFISRKTSTDVFADAIQDCATLDLSPVTNPDGYRSPRPASNEEAEKSPQALEREQAWSRERPWDFTARAYAGEPLAILDWGPGGIPPSKSPFRSPIG